MDPLEALSHVLLESPLELAILLFFALLACLIIWRRRRTVLSRRIFYVTALLGAALLALQALVQTDREQIRCLLDDVAACIDRQDLQSLARHIDANYGQPQHSKSQLLALLDGWRRRVEVDDPLLRDVRIDVADDQADVRLKAYCRLQVDHVPAGYVASTWRLQLRRRPDGWKLTLIEPLLVAGRRFASIWRLLSS